MRKKCLSKEIKGITLIALVITIIVLLILAGVTISAINSNENILEKTEVAVEVNDNANKIEEIQLKIINSKIEQEWDGTVADNFAGGEGTQEKPYKIESGAQLAFFAGIVNGELPLPGWLDDRTFHNKYITIENSINMGNKDFKPISYGSNSDTHSNEEIFTTGRIFQGDLNGKNNAISNLKIDNEDMQQLQGIGLVGVLGEYGTVRNVILGSGIIKCAYMGGLVGASKGKIINCYNGANIEAVKSNEDSGGSVGGMVGFSCQGTSIIDCYNAGNVTAALNNVGGIVGWIYEESSVKNCINSGTITCGKQKAGGIVGQISQGIIQNCSNTGMIQASSKEGRGVSGGIVGYLKNGTVEKVYNSGKIKVENGEKPNDTVAGIIGVQANGNLEYAYNKGSIEGGESTTTKYNGEVVGEKTGGSINKTFYLNEASSFKGIGGDNVDQTGTKATNKIFLTLNQFLKNIEGL